MSHQDLINAVNQIMPFGKYKGKKLIELPEPYLVWYFRQERNESLLNKQLALIYEIKLNGLESKIRPLVRR